MQIIIKTDCSIEEYVAKGQDFPFPEPRLCPNCKRGKPNKHGFYRRFCLNGHSIFRLLIRRFRCRACRITISLLPDFCIPRFQYSLSLLWKVLELRFAQSLSLKKCIEALLQKFPGLQWLPQRISFYANRFTGNLHRMESLLRSAFSRFKLDLNEEKRAKKVLVTVRSISGGIRKPARFFHEQCRRSFLAPLC